MFRPIKTLKLCLCFGLYEIYVIYVRNICKKFDSGLIKTLKLCLFYDLFNKHSFNVFIKPESNFFHLNNMSNPGYNFNIFNLNKTPTQAFTPPAGLCRRKWAQDPVKRWYTSTSLVPNVSDKRRDT